MGGVQQLGYLVFEVADLAVWEHFSVNVLGAQIARRDADGGFTLRIDGHKQRIFVRPGPLEDVAAVGLEFTNGSDLDAYVARIRAKGVDVSEAVAGEAAARDVAALYRLTEPGGMSVELFHTPAKATEPFSSAVVKTHFVADELGLGHVVLGAKSLAESEAFWTDVMEFRLSDHIVCDLGGYHVDIAFTHTNPRHHSIALGTGLPKRIHHFMLEVAAIDDVGLAYDRCADNRVRISQTIGRHPNDKMLSFYAFTPSGFEFEYGCGGRLIDDASWKPGLYDHISEWGHRRPPAPRPKT